MCLFTVGPLSCTLFSHFGLRLAMSFFFSQLPALSWRGLLYAAICMWRGRAARTAAKAAGGLCCRVVIVPCMGLTVTAGAQGLYLMSLYRPLPEARGL